MTETKFTPGPWSAYSVGERYIKGDEVFEIHFSSDGECVAEIVHGKADACLIAAAPELYDAAEKALRLLETKMASRDESLCLYLHRILKKARGEGDNNTNGETNDNT